MHPTTRLFAVALFTLLPLSARAAEEPVAPPLLIHEVRYDGRFSETAARFTVDLEVESTVRGESVAPLFTGEVAVLAPRLPTGLRVLRDGTEYRLVADRIGRFAVQLEVVAKITRKEPWNEISFVGPAAAIAAVAAEVTGPGVELQLLRGTLLESGKENDTARVRGFLGTERTVALRLQTRAADQTRAALLTCVTAARVALNPAVIKYTTELRYEILQGATSRLTIAVPAGQTLTRLEGDQIRDWQVAAQEDGQLLTVEFIKPVEKAYQLTLFTEQTVSKSPAAVALLPPQPREVERESGTLMYTAEDAVVEAPTATGLRQINAPAGTLAAYQFHARPFTLTATLQRIEPELTAFDRVRVQVEESRLLVTHGLRLTVAKAGVYAVTVRPPAGLTVTDVRGEGVADWRVRGGELQIEFAARVLGTRELEIPCETGFRTLPETVTIEALRVTGAKHENAQIGAGSAPGLQLKTADLTGAREVPVTQLSNRGNELLAYASVQPDWKVGIGLERLSARVVAELFNLVTVGDGLVGGSATIRYALLNQGVQELQVQVPAHLKNVEFTGPNIRGRDQEGEIWTITLQDKAWGGYTLVVTYDFQFDPQQAKLPIGGIHAVGVERETGTLAITSAANLQIAEASKSAGPTAGPGVPDADTGGRGSRRAETALSGDESGRAGARPSIPESGLKEVTGALHRIDESELDPADRGLITRPVLLAYRYSGDAYDLTLAVTRFQEQKVLEAVADRTQLTTVLTENGEMLTQASFMVKNNDKQFQRFTLPEHAEFWACYVGGEPAKATKDGTDLLVPLPRGANRDEAVPVDIVYASKIGSLKSKWWRSVRLAAPVTDIQTTYAEWELFVPATHVLAGFGGNMTVARGTVYGLRDAWREFVRFYDQLLRHGWPLGLVAVVVAGFVLLVVLAARRRWGTLAQVVGVVVVLAIFAAMLLPSLRRSQRRYRRLSAPPGTEAFTRPGSMVPPVAGPAEDREVKEITERLNRIVFPEINVRDAPITDIVGYLSEESRRVSPDGTGVNIILNLGESSGGRKVTVSLKQIPYLDALKLITAAANLKFRIEPTAVVILPRDAPEGELITRSYPIEAGVMLQQIPPPPAQIGSGELSGFGGGGSSDHAKQFFADAGVSFPEGSSVVYNERTGRLIVRNTPANMEALENTLAVVHAVPARGRGDGWGRFLGRPAAVSGIRPLRIDIPKTGERFVFTKVLNVHGDPLSVRAWALAVKARNALRAVLQIVAFLVGAALVFWQWMAIKRRAVVMAAGWALVLASVGSVLLAYRALEVVLILAPPVVVLAAIVWLARRWKQRHPKPPTPPAPPPVIGPSELPTPPPVEPSPAVPPVVAGLILALCLAGLVQAADKSTPVPARPAGGSQSSATEKPAQEPIALPEGRTAGPTVTSALYHGEVREVTAIDGQRTAEFEAVLELLASEPNQRVKLFGPEVAIQEVSSGRGGFFGGGGRVRLERDNGGFSLVLPRAGKVTARVRFLVKVTGTVAQRNLAFDIPAALSGQLELVLDEAEATVEVPSAVSFQTTKEPDRTKVSAVIGAANKIAVQWNPRVKRAEEIAATVFCQNATLATIGSGVLNLRSILDYQVTQGELREIRVAVPPGHRVLRVEGELIRTWKVDGTDPEQVLVVELIKGVTPAYKLTVETETALPADRVGKPLAIVVPRALEVTRETGWVALRSAEELTLAVERSDELQKVDAEEFVRAAAVKPAPAMAYRFLKPEFTLAVRVDVVQPQIEAVVRNTLRVGADQLRLSVQAEYTIKRAGVFTLRLNLPADYRLTQVIGENIAQWVDKTEAGTRFAEVTLKQRTIGAYGLRLELVQLVQTLPPVVAVTGVQPVGAQKLTGYVAVSAEEGVQVKSQSFDGLTEIPPSQMGLGDPSAPRTGGALLAYKYIQSEAQDQLGWQAAVTTEKLPSWIRAEIVNWVTVTETLVSGRTLVRYEIQNAPAKEFGVRVPASYKNVELTGANIRRKDETNHEWRVELQSRVRGVYTLTVTWDRPTSAAGTALELPGIEALEVERETGVVAINAQPPLRVTEHEAGADLLSIDAREVPEWAGRSDGAAVLAYRYLRPGYRLALTAERFEEAEVLQALVDSARFATVVADDGQLITEMTLQVRNNGRQYLELKFPDQAQVWSAFVAGQPVRPSRRDGKLLLPLERSVGDAPVSVQVIYVGVTGFPAVRGQVELTTPTFDVPVKSARWELYLPTDYDYTGFAGSMRQEKAVETVAVRRRTSKAFSLGDYLAVESAQKLAQIAEVKSNLGRANVELEGGKLKAAAEAYANVKRSARDEAVKEDVKKLEKSLRQAQGSNLLQAQQRLVEQNTFQQTEDVNQPPPAKPMSQQGQQIARYQEEVAEQQWDKLQQAQEIAVAAVQPLRVNLPLSGVRYAFTQVLQLETGKELSVSFSAVNEKEMGWPTRIGLAALGFVVLWVIVALTWGRKRED
ncbi:hypothetical protein HQ590_11360 [bacterium]|nr:hypothetical protein [bacterium]